MGELKATNAVRHGAREGPLAVAKELALQELLGDCCAVDGNKIGACSHALLVQGASQKFFARAALAGDHDRGVGVGDRAQEASEGLG